MPMPIVSKVFTALNDELTLPASSVQMFYRIQVVGAGSMTLDLEDSWDGGTNYQKVQVRDEGALSLGSMTVAAMYSSIVGPLLYGQPRIRASAFVSGTLTAYVLPVQRAFRKQRFPLVDVTFNGASQTRDLPAGLGMEGAFVFQVIESAPSLTVQLQDSLDDANWSPIAVKNSVNQASSANVVGQGLYIPGTNPCLRHPRLAVTAFTSGTLRFLFSGALVGD